MPSLFPLPFHFGKAHQNLTGTGHTTTVSYTVMKAHAHFLKVAPHIHTYMYFYRNIWGTCFRNNMHTEVSMNKMKQNTWKGIKIEGRMLESTVKVRCVSNRMKNNGIDNTIPARLILKNTCRKSLTQNYVK